MERMPAPPAIGITLTNEAVIKHLLGEVVGSRGGTLHSGLVELHEVRTVPPIQVPLDGLVLLANLLRVFLIPLSMSPKQMLNSTVPSALPLRNSTRHWSPLRHQAVDCNSSSAANLIVPSPPSSPFIKSMSLQLANVTPVYKKGWKEDLGNHRPVSPTSVLGKVMEQIIFCAITQHIQDNQATRPSQHGCMKGKSCLTNPISFYDKVTRLMDDGKAVDVVYVDCKSK
ncbi:rna-directed dna polymerase from mobile element jockey-like [Limosa lapponica baueri]|uniref:Rna-directed dna polymerase from mobile element jockey-like n=1 Tax=Limosa lapponica baueri TaxID=1758121 RepID=A0A2I0TE89_LIMLA|nr:rna-directed dna polymerase from mobile element jockey-like [Limosa lapponica baueri]